MVAATVVAATAVVATAAVATAVVATVAMVTAIAGTAVLATVAIATTVVATVAIATTVAATVLVAQRVPARRWPGASSFCQACSVGQAGTGLRAWAQWARRSQHLALPSTELVLSLWVLTTRPPWPRRSSHADGVLAQDSSQARQMWHIREGITEALRHRGGPPQVLFRSAGHSSLQLPPATPFL